MADWLSESPSERMGENMQRFLRHWHLTPGFSGAPGGIWHPPVDIHLKADAVIVRIDLPGVDPKEVDISVEGNRLTVRGTRPPCAEAVKDEDCWHNETNRGQFHRVLDLPEYVDGGKTTATYGDGILVITMPKKEEAKPKMIEIKTK